MVDKNPNRVTKYIGATNKEEQLEALNKKMDKTLACWNVYTHARQSVLDSAKYYYGLICLSAFATAGFHAAGGADTLSAVYDGATYLLVGGGLTFAVNKLVDVSYAIPKYFVQEMHDEVQALERAIVIDTPNEEKYNYQAKVLRKTPDETK